MSNDGNTGKKQSGFPGNTIGALYFGTNEADKLAAIYDLLIYNDVEKCYYVTGLEVDDDLEYRIYFENGHISKIRIDETGDYQIMTVSDIGTTTIDNIPEWTVAS
jgi:hypothetical protein